MKPLTDCQLYAFVDTTYLRGRGPGAVAQQLCDGGADLLQLRAKQSSLAEIRTLAKAILPVTQKAGIGLVINDHLAVAQELGTEFCHLGQEDFFGAGYTHVSQLSRPCENPNEGGRASSRAQTLLENPSESGLARTLALPQRQVPTQPVSLAAKAARGHSPAEGTHVLIPQVRVGLSTHTPEQAERAAAAGADYLGVGPVYQTGTKTTARPVTLDHVRWAAANVRIPWFAIGGITLENLEDVLAAGARRVCVVSAILNAVDPAAACRQFKARLHAVGPGR